MVIVEGDSEQMINEQSTRVIVDPIDVRLPVEMAGRVKEIAAEQRKQVAGQPYFWNGLNYSVTTLAISRTPVDESPEV